MGVLLCKIKSCMLEHITDCVTAQSNMCANTIVLCHADNIDRHPVLKSGIKFSFEYMVRLFLFVYFIWYTRILGITKDTPWKRCLNNAIRSTISGTPSHKKFSLKIIIIFLTVYLLLVYSVKYNLSILLLFIYLSFYSILF